MERIEKYCYTKKDFKIDWFSGTGPGGQNRNKVQACVRVTHIPSGLQCVGQNNRSRTANFRDAFQALGIKVGVWVQAQISAETIGRTTSDVTIRTYNYAENRVVDHASGLKTATRNLDKDFGLLIEARKQACQAPAMNNET